MSKEKPKEADLKPKETEPAQGGLKRVNIGAHVFAQIVLAVLLFGFVNYLGSRHEGRKDLTEDLRYTVSAETAEFLKDLEKPVKITMAFSKSNSRIEPQLSVLLDQYAELSEGRVTVDKFDPLRETQRALEFSNSTKSPLTGNMVVLEFGDGGRRKVITEEEMLADDGRLFLGEDVITSRIIGTMGKDQLVYILGSYGGLREVNGRTQMTELSALANQHFAKVEPLVLADVAEIPYADAIVIYNPDKDIEERDVRLLRDYWQYESGSLLIFLNPQVQTPRLDAFIESVGVTRRDDQVLYAVNSALDARAERRVQARFLAGSTITEPTLSAVTTFGGITCSLDVAAEDIELAQQGISAVPLMRATELFWGEKDYDVGGLPVRDEDDHQQPIYIAAAVERGGGDGSMRGESSRMVVVANGTLLDPYSIERSNADFVMNSLNWILDREELIGITPKRAVIYNIDMSSKQVSWTFTLVVIVMPLLVFALAVAMWIIRRA